MIFKTEVLGNITFIAVALFVLFKGIYFFTSILFYKYKKIHAIADFLSAKLFPIIIIVALVFG